MSYWNGDGGRCKGPRDWVTVIGAVQDQGQAIAAELETSGRLRPGGRPGARERVRRFATVAHCGTDLDLTGIIPALG